MKYRFRALDYQTKAVDSIIEVFKNQGSEGNDIFTIDDSVMITEESYANKKISLSEESLLSNIKAIQGRNNIIETVGLKTKTENETLSTSTKKLKTEKTPFLELDIEMETGTGKTYVYTRTIFELNRQYGWKKFIVIVPSIAIREGVKKSFEMTTEHFKEVYKKQASYFIYNSDNISSVRSFCMDEDISVMIINNQAFSRDFEDTDDIKKRSKLKIFQKLDKNMGRSLIEDIARVRPILILDEPQRLQGKGTQRGLALFQPLLILNFSATLTKVTNLLYSLDPVDSYNQKLVKRIEVKGIEVLNQQATGGYVHISKIIVSPSSGPKALVEFLVNHKTGIRKKLRTLSVGDNLYDLSSFGEGVAKLEIYKDNYIIKEIDGTRGTVSFENAILLEPGQAAGDVHESDFRRIQITQTILSHFEKEFQNFPQKIKTLSLFFIDEVAKYKKYDEEGNEQKGIYAEVFEEVYADVLYNEIEKYRPEALMYGKNVEYYEYLKGLEGQKTHNGYFSIDKKGKSIDSHIAGRGSDKGLSDDISAYDLILKNKERLLSFDEPTRFIFSHSALREGWDNPNVFCICTLKHSTHEINRRQEIGRGMRICVNSEGQRQDVDCLKENVHKVNKLTVITSESYTTFVKELQNEYKENTVRRPTKAEEKYFRGKVLLNEAGEKLTINQEYARMIHRYLIKNEYIDDDDLLKDSYKQAVENESFAELPEVLQPFESSLHKLIQNLYQKGSIEIENAFELKQKTTLNKNFESFQTLWDKIKDKYTFHTYFETSNLVNRAVNEIHKNLNVSKSTYKITSGIQKETLYNEMLTKDSMFEGENVVRDETTNPTSHIKYNLIKTIADQSRCKHSTVKQVLTTISPEKFALYTANPEAFIAGIVNILKKQVNALTVEGIFYSKLADEQYHKSIFENDISQSSIAKSIKNPKKHITDYVVTDSNVENSFASDLEKEDDVKVYAKLPKSFTIPTPFGDYTPDWAIVFDSKNIKYIYLIAETKGSADDQLLREIENQKINCARKLYNEQSNDIVRYHVTSSLQDLISHLQ